ncbi:hypothetical protein MKX03_026069 [Papaver bracteatum]|nr:hypothetical protein MKX03_026069 [Papaver bracteatum]
MLNARQDQRQRILTDEGLTEKEGESNMVVPIDICHSETMDDLDVLYEKTDELDLKHELELKQKKYQRGDGVKLEGLKNKKLRGQLAVRENLIGQSANVAAKAEKWLNSVNTGYLEAEGIEKTWNYKNQDIVRSVDMLSSKKAFDLVLPDLGPYTMDYTANGRYMAMAGRKGHLAIIDTQTLKQIKEFQVRETVHDVAFFHNELYFAAAQKKYTYIYNNHGIELHCLKEHGAVQKLQFMRNHFLLATINKSGQLHYQDVTTGFMVSNFQTRLGQCDVMQVNPFNAVVGLGHLCGKVTMWNPISAVPLVKMLCHQGSISAIAHHPGGNLMATAGLDGTIKLWDLRKFEVLKTYFRHAKTLDFSQNGLLAIGNGSRVQIWKDNGDQDYGRYMTHDIAKGYQVGEAKFQPYEDVLCLGHTMGISTILVPGSGEANFDTFVANPFDTKKQRREKEIKSLLDKLPPETVMLNPTKIGTLKPARKKEQPSQKELEAEKEDAVVAVKLAPRKKKTKGRSKPSKIESKKQESIMKTKRPYLDQQMKEGESRKKLRVTEEVELPKSLARFARKKAAVV